MKWLSLQAPGDPLPPEIGTAAGLESAPVAKKTAILLSPVILHATALHKR